MTKNGHTAVPMPMALWSQVDTSGGPNACWPWRGKLNGSGYGSLRRKGYGSGAHQAAWIVTYGPIPKGHHVLHRCDHRWCCNPKCLFTGTHQINMDDMVSKRRSNPAAKSRPGSRHGRAKLTESDVLAIRAAVQAGVERATDGRFVNHGVRELALKYGVNPTLISQIVRRRIWRHI